MKRQNLSFLLVPVFLHLLQKIFLQRVDIIIAYDRISFTIWAYCRISSVFFFDPVSDPVDHEDPFTVKTSAADTSQHWISVFSGITMSFDQLTVCISFFSHQLNHKSFIKKRCPFSWTPYKKNDISAILNLYRSESFSTPSSISSSKAWTAFSLSCVPATLFISSAILCTLIPLR